MTAVERVVVVVPAHDEQELLDECLRALQLSAHAIPVPTELVVVLDACTMTPRRWSIAGRELW